MTDWLLTQALGRGPSGGSDEPRYLAPMREETVRARRWLTGASGLGVLILFSDGIGDIQSLGITFSGVAADAPSIAVILVILYYAVMFWHFRKLDTLFLEFVRMRHDRQEKAARSQAVDVLRSRAKEALAAIAAAEAAAAGPSREFEDAEKAVKAQAKKLEGMQTSLKTKKSDFDRGVRTRTFSSNPQEIEKLERSVKKLKGDLEESKNRVAQLRSIRAPLIAALEDAKKLKDKVDNETNEAKRALEELPKATEEARTVNRRWLLEYTVPMVFGIVAVICVMVRIFWSPFQPTHVPDYMSIVRELLGRTAFR